MNNKIYVPPNPCKGCTLRKLYCHGECADYQDWKKLNDYARRINRESFKRNMDFEKNN